MADFESFNKSLPLAGRFVPQDLKVSADDLYIGMPMSYDGVNDRYIYDASTPEIVCMQTGTFADDDYCNMAVAGSEIDEDGIVNDSGVALAVTDDMRQSWLKNAVVVRSS